MALQIYLNFNGNCLQAVEFYTEVFKVAKQEIMFYGDTPPQEGFPITEEMKKLVMHTFLNINGTTLMFSDLPSGTDFSVGNNISIVVNSKDMEEIQFQFNKLKEGGSVGMELQETFWSKCYGFVTDQFGVGWQFNLEGEGP